MISSRNDGLRMIKCELKMVDRGLKLEDYGKEKCSINSEVLPRLNNLIKKSRYYRFKMIYSGLGMRSCELKVMDFKSEVENGRLLLGNATKARQEGSN